MVTAIHRRVAALQRGEDPTVIGKVHSGWLVAGEVQIVPGYCLLLCDPVVEHLNDLEHHARDHFLRDMAHIGDLLLQVTDADRINYEILGNLEPALHAHLIPRFNAEPEHTRTKPIWLHDWDSARRFDMAVDRNWVDVLRQSLQIAHS